jgi:hypothetical protein
MEPWGFVMTSEELKTIAQMPFGTYREVALPNRPITTALLDQARHGDRRAIEGRLRLQAGYDALHLAAPR